MIDHGAHATEDQQQLIYAYLVRYFGAPAPAP
jgi:hypothetical protein